MDFGTQKKWQNNIKKIKKEILLEKNRFPKFLRNKILTEHLLLLLEDKLIQFCKNKKVGILFSGGVDSSVLAILCKKLEIDYYCYCVGFKDENTKIPEDIVIAKRISEQYELKTKTKLYDLKQAREVIEQTALILKNTEAFDVVNIGVGSVEYAGMQLAKKDNCEIVLSGLGSEEIFAGYQRHEKASDKEEECWNGLLMMYKRDLIRETLLPKAFNLETYAPFLDFDIIRIAMQISIKAKISRKQNKIVIRKIAKKLGLKEFAKRKKRAAQYGSRFNNAIMKLSDKKGFKYAKDYINSITGLKSNK